MALDDPVSRAANDYLANTLTLRFTPDARDTALDYLSLRERSDEYLGTDADLTGEKLQQATQNALKFLREAEQMARQNGDEVVTRQIVVTAWIKFCPGFFPFC